MLRLRLHTKQENKWNFMDQQLVFVKNQWYLSISADSGVKHCRTHGARSPRNLLMMKVVCKAGRSLKANPEVGYSCSYW